MEAPAYSLSSRAKELKKFSTEVASDKDLANVASVSAGGNPEIGQLIADAMAKVGRQGVVTMEESKTAEDNLVFVEGMQFDRGYYSPYFVTDPERMVAEYENCKVLLVDKKISTARDIIGACGCACVCLRVRMCVCVCACRHARWCWAGDARHHRVHLSHMPSPGTHTHTHNTRPRARRPAGGRHPRQLPSADHGRGH